MEATTYYGRQVTCHVCQKKELKSYTTHTPAFADAINSVFIGWCDKHEIEAKQYIAEIEGVKDRTNQGWSNS